MSGDKIFGSAVTLFIKQTSIGPFSGLSIEIVYWIPNFFGQIKVKSTSGHNSLQILPINFGLKYLVTRKHPL